MALVLGNLEILADAVTIPVDSANDAADDGNGVELTATSVYTLEGNGGSLTYDATGWDIADGATIQVLGFECTLVLSAADKARFDNGDFNVQIVDPKWTPADEPDCLLACDSANVVTSPTFEVPSDVGSNKLVSAGGNSALPTVNATTGALQFVAGANQCLAIETAINEANPWVFVVFAEYSTTGINTFLSGTTISAASGGVIRGEFGDRRNWNGNEIYWNGQTDGSGGVVVQTNVDQGFENVGGSSWAAQSNWWLLIEGDSQITSDIKHFFAATKNGTTFERSGGAEVIYISVHRDRPSDDDIQRLQGFGGWELADRIAGVTAQDRLPADHPYNAERPLRTAGGATSSVVVIAPVLTLTIVAFPVGSEVRIYDLDSTLPDFGTELAGVESSPGTSFEYSHTAPGDTVMLQILATGFEEINQIIMLATVSQTVDVSEDLIVDVNTQ